MMDIKIPIIRRLRLKSIRNRITLYFSVLVISITFIIIYVTIGLFTVRFLENKNKLVSQKLSFITQDIGSKISEYRNAAISLKNVEAVRDIFIGANYNEELVQNYFDQFIENTYGMQSVIPLDEDLNVIGDNIFFNNGEFIFSIPEVGEFFISNIEDKISPPHNYPSSGATKNYMSCTKVTYIHTVRDEIDYSVCGYLLINFEKNVLFNSIREYCLDLFDSTYIISKTGNIIARIGPDNYVDEKTAVDLAKKHNYESGYQNTLKNTYFRQQINQYPEWVIIGVVSNKSLMSDMYLIISVIVLIGLMGIITVIIISHKVSGKITEPINMIKDSMKAFERGELPEKLDTQTDDELAYLIKGFNSMIDDINRLVEAIYHEEDEKYKAEVAAVQFQLDSLQSQINPHFLYNTLNTVTYLAVKYNNPEIRELIQSLNSLLRSTLSNQNRFVTIGQELSITRDYIKIQDYRYPEMAQIQYDLDEDILEYQIPKLILQPIVENALLHGIFPKGEQGRIIISLKSSGKRINISIKDNGVGIDKETFKEIRNNAGGFNSVGLSNVDERLDLYYGSKSRLIIISEKNEGTEVRFSIPKTTHMY